MFKYPLILLLALPILSVRPEDSEKTNLQTTKNRTEWITPEKTSIKSERRRIFISEILRKPYSYPRRDRGTKQWLEETQGGYPDYYLSGIQDVDTFMVWFEPIYSCSVLAYEVTTAAFLDTSQKFFTMFFSDLVDSIDYASFPEYHSDTSPSIHSGFQTVIQSRDTFCSGLDTAWTVVTETLSTPFDNKRGKFAVGWTKTRGDSSPNPNIYANGNPPYHSLTYRDFHGTNRGWYSSYHAFKCRALVSSYSSWIYNNPMELSDSYTEDVRDVYIEADLHGFPNDSIQDISLFYRTNSGTTSTFPCSLVQEDPLGGELWLGEIPGVSPGDTVSYFSILNTVNGISDTSQIRAYVIRQGNPGHFLWVEDDYTESSYPGIFTRYSHLIDFWDCDEYGFPDSSVISFYSEGMDDTSRTIIWKGWASTILGQGNPVIWDMAENDSSYIKQHLEAGGNLFLADQDQGYAFGITPAYGQASVSGWVRDYLGIRGIYDDHPVTGGKALTLLSTDPVFSDLFSGAGNQTPGEIFLTPYYQLTGNLNYAYTCVFDSLLPFASKSMNYDTLCVAYRLDGDDGTTHTGKVVNFGFPWEYVANPSDTLIDSVAVDTLFEDVLHWLGIETGVNEESLEPAKLTRLYNIGIVMEQADIKFFLPEKEIVEISIYDATGRRLKKLVNHNRKSGINIVRWNVNVPSGIYFCRLKAGDEILTEKFEVLK